MNTLIVDDEKNIRKTLSMILTEFDSNIKEAGSVEEADLLINRDFFDIAIVDIRLPDGSGVEILKKIRNDSPDTIV
ncbi:MAG TPA: response regulator, partial [Nitrospirae bacterium]|nr:response regulator [Nitrospirota bacterium]